MCNTPLKLTHDRQRNTPFIYWRCEAGHGRFTPFVEFLREKDFIRAPSPEQLAELRRSIQMIRCASCGAPIDLATSTACEFCRAPIAILDPEAASRAVRELASAAASTTTAPAMDDAARTAAGIMAAAQFQRALAREQAQRADGFAVDLIEVGLTALAAVLMRH
jgi:hypothetical protein